MYSEILTKPEGCIQKYSPSLRDVKGEGIFPNTSQGEKFQYIPIVRVYFPVHPSSFDSIDTMQWHILQYWNPVHLYGVLDNLTALAVVGGLNAIFFAYFSIDSLILYVPPWKNDW